MPGIVHSTRGEPIRQSDTASSASLRRGGVVADRLDHEQAGVVSAPQGRLLERLEPHALVEVPGPGIVGVRVGGAMKTSHDTR